MAYAVLRSRHNYLNRKLENKLAVERFLRFNLTLSSSGTKGSGLFDMGTGFTLTCSLWLRSKLPCGVISIMLRVNMFPIMMRTLFTVYCVSFEIRLNIFRPSVTTASDVFASKFSDRELNQ